MISITKEHEFDFGHRVWSQELDGEFAGSIDCKCKHLHGHRGKIEVTLFSDVGLQRGMVTDFTHLKKFFNWIDATLDHKFLVDINDPAIGMDWLPFVGEIQDNVQKLLSFQNYVTFTFDKSNGTIEGHEGIFSQPTIEIYESLTIVDFVPTAENICEWLRREIHKHLPKNIKCQSITFYETPKAKATWEN